MSVDVVSWSSYAVDGAGNLTKAFLPKSWKGNGTRAGLIYCHGDGGSYQEGTAGSDAGLAALVQAIVDAGYPIITSDCGGVSTWGGPAAQTAISNARTLLQNLGCSTSKVGLWGQSMGHMAALIWAANNLSATACVMGTFPVSNAASMYWENGSYQTQIDTAYSARTDASCGTTSGSPVVTDTAIGSGDVGKMVRGTGIPASPVYVGPNSIAGTSIRLSSSPTSQVDVNATATGTVSLTISYKATAADPTVLAWQGAFTGLNWRAYYGTADTTVTPADVQGLATAMGQSGNIVPVVGANHSYPNQTYVSLSDVLAFLGAHL